MLRATILALGALILLAGCSTVGGPYPSLAPRPAEKVDPRVPVEKPLNDRPASAALTAHLGALVAQARSGEAAFASAMAAAERAASNAGAPQSEGWIAAQEALSAAVEARGPASRALSEIDAIGADRLQADGGLSPADLAAVEQAAATVSAITDQQAARVRTVQARLGG